MPTPTLFPDTICCPPIRFQAEIGERRRATGHSWRELILAGLEHYEDESTTRAVEQLFKQNIVDHYKK